MDPQGDDRSVGGDGGGERFFAVIRRRDREIVFLARKISDAATASVRFSRTEEHYVRPALIKILSVENTFRPVEDC